MSKLLRIVLIILAFSLGMVFQRQLDQVEMYLCQIENNILMSQLKLSWDETRACQDYAQTDLYAETGVL